MKNTLFAPVTIMQKMMGTSIKANVIMHKPTRRCAVTMTTICKAFKSALLTAHLPVYNENCLRGFFALKLTI